MSHVHHAHEEAALPFVQMVRTRPPGLSYPCRQSMHLLRIFYYMPFER